MAWNDLKKVFDVVPHSWFVKCMPLFGVASDVIRVGISSMSKWKMELSAGGVSLGEVNIRREIFQGDSCLPSCLC